MFGQKIYLTDLHFSCIPYLEFLNFTAKQTKNFKIGLQGIQKNGEWREHVTYLVCAGPPISPSHPLCFSFGRFCKKKSSFDIGLQTWFFFLI